MNGVALTCPACEFRRPLGTEPTHFERQALEAVPCPGCGGHTLRCVNVVGKRARGGPAGIARVIRARPTRR